MKRKVRGQSAPRRRVSGGIPGIDPGRFEHILNDPEVIIHCRDPREPFEPFRPVLHVVQPISVQELLNDDDDEVSRG